MKPNLVDLALCHRCSCYAVRFILLAVADYLAAALVSILAPERQFAMWAFFGLGLLASFVAAVCSFYPAWMYQRQRKAALESDNGNYVDPV
jgi:membrane protein DedA with SNARE-associated domain